jgi:methyl-accepting chemotaxis protein
MMGRSGGVEHVVRHGTLHENDNHLHKAGLHDLRIVRKNLGLGRSYIETRDEIADTAGDFNELLGSLRGSIGEVGSASSSVSAASVELDASVEEMSRNAELLNSHADGIRYKLSA